MGKNCLKMGVWLSFFYKFAENKDFFQGRFLPYKLGIETPTRRARNPFKPGIIRCQCKMQVMHL